MQRCGGSCRTPLYACRWLRSWVIWLRVHGEILFPHRSFQEYVAGLQLASFSGHANDTSEGLKGFSGISWHLGGQGGSYWRYVLRFALGSLSFQDFYHSIRAKNLFERLLDKIEGFGSTG